MLIRFITLIYWTKEYDSMTEKVSEEVYSV